MTNNYPTESSEQNVLNKSFDKDFEVLTTEGLEFDGTSLKRKQSSLLQIKIVETATETYVCKAAVGTAESVAKWQCYKVDAEGSKKFADANTNFDNVASDPAALTYSYS